MRAYQDMVFTTASRLTGNDRQAEDIAQDVFVRAYEHFPELRSSPTAGGWLKTVATNLSLNYLTRYRKRWRMFSDYEDSDDGDSPVPARDEDFEDSLPAGLGAEQRRTLIEEALGRLPTHQRVPLVLFHFEDLDYLDIAGRLGVSLAKVKTDIRRGRLALLAIFKAAGVAREHL
jgi:RNA polymerase sigma-70 factor (ECF subfamily)